MGELRVCILKLKVSPLRPPSMGDSYTGGQNFCKKDDSHKPMLIGIEDVPNPPLRGAWGVT